MIFSQLILNRHLVFAAALLLSVGWFANDFIVTGQGSLNQNRQTKTRPVRNKEARKLFKQHCAKCHGADGAGETVQGKIAGAPDFTDPQWHEQFEDQGLIYSVTHGRSQMPAFGKKLTQQQIKALVNYVRAFRK